MKWPMVSLEDVLSLQYGTALPAARRDSSGNVPVAGSNGVDGYHTEALIRGPGIVVGRKGSAGKVTWFESDFWPIDTTFYVRPKIPADLRWVFYLLQYLRLDRLSIITGVPGINRNDVYKLKVPLPPLSEQRRIVEILDQADALRRKRAEADAKAERILRSLFINMFGNPVTKSKGWDRVPLKRLLRKSKGALQSGPFGSNLHNSDFVSDGTVFVVGIDNVHDSGFQTGRNRHITWEKYQELRKYSLEPNDVLITIMGTVGRACVFPEWIGEAICTKHVYRIQVDEKELNPEYLCASFQFSPSIRAQLRLSTTGQIVDAITSRNPRELIVDVPPIDLQSQFAHYKKSFDSEANRRESSRSKLNSLFEILLHRAFSGDLTAKWREAHMQELSAEMDQQAKWLAEENMREGRETACLQQSLFRDEMPK
jgi:type I restriction enzyme S subunit